MLYNKDYTKLRYSSSGLKHNVTYSVLCIAWSSLCAESTGILYLGVSANIPMHSTSTYWFLGSIYHLSMFKRAKHRDSAMKHDLTREPQNQSQPEDVRCHAKLSDTRPLGVSSISFDRRRNVIDGERMKYPDDAGPRY